MASSEAERAARPPPQGRALEPVGDRRPREMTVAPKGEQNPAYVSHRFFTINGTFVRYFVVILKS